MKTKDMGLPQTPEPLQIVWPPKVSRGKRLFRSVKQKKLATAIVSEDNEQVDETISLFTSLRLKPVRLVISIKKVSFELFSFLWFQWLMSLYDATCASRTWRKFYHVTIIVFNNYVVIVSNQNPIDFVAGLLE